MGATPIVTEPAEPDEILWENLGTPMVTKIQLRILNSFLTLLMLGVSFGIILLLKYAQVVYFSNRPGQDNENDFAKTLLSLAITASISFINTLLVPLIRAVTLKEKYSTITNYNVEVAQRLAIVSDCLIQLDSQVQFLNTSVLILLVNWILYKQDLRNFLWNNKGFSNDAWFIMLFNIFLPPISSILDPWVLYRQYKRNNIMKNANTLVMTQKEANLWFEGSPFDIAQKYANQLKTVMMSFFFLPMFPLAIPACVLALVTAKFTEKFLLYRRYACPKASGSQLNLNMYRFFDLIILVFAVGYSRLNLNLQIAQVIFDYIFRLSVTAYSWIFFIVALAHYIFGFHYLYNKLFKFENNEHLYSKSRYEDQRMQFITEYDRCNPMTQAKATREFLDHLKGIFLVLTLIIKLTPQQKNQNFLAKLMS